MLCISLWHVLHDKEQERFFSIDRFVRRSEIPTFRKWDEGIDSAQKPLLADDELFSDEGNGGGRAVCARADAGAGGDDTGEDGGSRLSSDVSSHSAFSSEQTYTSSQRGFSSGQTSDSERPFDEHHGEEAAV